MRVCKDVVLNQGSLLQKSHYSRKDKKSGPKFTPYTPLVGLYNM